jgi:hypothetical protein
MVSKTLLGAAMAFVLLLAPACTNPATNIVKSSVIDEQEGVTITVEDWLNAIAGINGQVQWQELTPEGGQSSHLRVVKAEVNCSFGDESHQASLEWVVNNKTKQFQTARVIIDGEKKSILRGMMTLDSWATLKGLENLILSTQERRLK